MAVPILWEPGMFAFFLLENLHAHKTPHFWGGGGVGGGGDVSEDFYAMINCGTNAILVPLHPDMCGEIAE